MKQLTIKDIFDAVNKLQKSGVNFNDIMKMPVYIGNDDELNGIHCAWYVQSVDAKTNNDGEKWLVNMINEDISNHKLEDKGLLIS